MSCHSGTVSTSHNAAPDAKKTPVYNVFKISGTAVLAMG